MSATGRSDVRNADDYYRTPSWCVHRLLDELLLPAGIWLEPSCGDGAIIRAVNEVRQDVRWHAVEHSESVAQPVHPLVERAWFGHNFLGWTPPCRYGVAIMNPPYRMAMEHVQRALACATRVAALLRLNWLASAERAAWMRENTPDVYVLPDRPSFTGKGSDAVEYAWMVWDVTRPGRTPGVTILPTTRLDERAQQQRALEERGQLLLFGGEA